VTSGLERVDQLPVGGGYAELEVGAVGTVDTLSWLAHLEAGFHPAASVDVFTYGQADLKWGDGLSWQAGLGARVHW
jgi:hypothetical protein